MLCHDVMESPGLKSATIHTRRVSYSKFRSRTGISRVFTGVWPVKSSHYDKKYTFFLCPINRLESHRVT